jgi:hypothetical protein
LSSSKNFYIKLTPSTESTEFGSNIKDLYPEDYLFKFEIDSGFGFIDRTPLNNGIKSGETAEIDIREFLTTGINRVRIIVTGTSSN